MLLRRSSFRSWRSSPRRRSSTYRRAGHEKIDTRVESNRARVPRESSASASDRTLSGDAGLIPVEIPAMPLRGQAGTRGSSMWIRFLSRSLYPSANFVALSSQRRASISPQSASRRSGQCLTTHSNARAPAGQHAEQLIHRDTGGQPSHVLDKPLRAPRPKPVKTRVVGRLQERWEVP